MKQTAVFLGPVSTAPMFLFSGFLVSFNAIPAYLRWIRYIVYTSYGFEGTLLAIYAFDRPNLNCTEAYCHYKSPSKFLDFFDLREAVYWLDVVALLSYYLIVRILTYFVLKYRIRGCL